jgi:hypothetical protein
MFTYGPQRHRDTEKPISSADDERINGVFFVPFVIFVVAF